MMPARIDQLVEDLQRLAGQGLFTLLVNPAIAGLSTLSTVAWTSTRIVMLCCLTPIRKFSRLARQAASGSEPPPWNRDCDPTFQQCNHLQLSSIFAGQSISTGTRLCCAGFFDGQGECRVEVKAPTGVGFCMYIKRAVLKEVGQFDEKNFGRGYGEENDFCQRAILKGWQNIIAADIFVRHWGATSFKVKRLKGCRRRLKRLVGCTRGIRKT